MFQINFTDEAKILVYKRLKSSFTLTLKLKLKMTNALKPYLECNCCDSAKKDFSRGCLHGFFFDKIF